MILKPGKNHLMRNNAGDVKKIKNIIITPKEPERYGSNPGDTQITS